MDISVIEQDLSTIAYIFDYEVIDLKDDEWCEILVTTYFVDSTNHSLEFTIEANLDSFQIHGVLGDGARDFDLSKEFGDYGIDSESLEFEFQTYDLLHDLRHFLELLLQSGIYTMRNKD
ncbi:MAG: hypothetical protein E7K04_03390 [Helicobacter sp.]|nr:hypothetical protein [Helicobacter sp.]